MKRALTACLPVLLLACGAGADMDGQATDQADNQSPTEVGQLSDVSQPIRVGISSQYDLTPRLEALLGPALPGQQATDEVANTALKRSTSTAYGDADYSVDTVFGASAKDWAVKQWDKSSHYGLMGLLNETVGKRLCMISYWTQSVGSIFEPTALQRQLGINEQDLVGKAGEALQGFCPALSDADMGLLSAATPLSIWYEVSDVSDQPDSQYQRVLRYQIAGSASGGQEGTSVRGEYFHQDSPGDLRFLLSEQSDRGDSLYVALNQDADRDLIALEGQRLTANQSDARQAIYRLRLDRLNGEASTLVHAHKAAGYPATDLAVLLTHKVSAGGQVAVTMGAAGLYPLTDAFACADWFSLDAIESAGESGVCDGAIAASISPWFRTGRPQIVFDSSAVEALDETSIVNFASVDEMLSVAPVTGQIPLQSTERQINPLAPF